ncbi:MAG: protein-glutamate O-methyltransferase CheR [Clostridiales bacterium]|nr:protein-glutamate O-methyltransferase CheR [Clostridiales bacterium]
MIAITDKEFEQLSAYIRKQYGINLRSEKRNLVMGRLYNELVKNGFSNYTDYINYVLSDKSGMALNTLINKITTNHTYFMREAEHFHYFREVVMPYLLQNEKSRDLRIWSAGCSSGEEPYTLAMIIDELLGRNKVWWDTKILATDISSKVLEKAINACYEKEELENISPQWRLNYFQKVDENRLKVVDRIRNEVIFRRLNLMDDIFPFKRKFHVIFCRNVMIYFDKEIKQRLINKFYNQLESGGYLFIGHSETIEKGTSNFRYIMPAVYRKD